MKHWLPVLAFLAGLGCSISSGQLVLTEECFERARLKSCHKDIYGSWALAHEGGKQ
jgi:hypothetical protein